MQATTARIKGRIEKVFYAGPTFSAGRLLSDQQESIQFAGKFFAKENQPVILRGKWITHPKYGRQFKVKAMEHNLKLNPAGLAHYLANHPDFKGIGPVKAKLIADRFGQNIEESLTNEPELVASTARVSLATIMSLRKEWLANRNANAVMSWLASFNLTHNQATTLVTRLGENCLDILKENPYILVQEIRGFGFKKVDEIARKMGTTKDNPMRLQAGLHFCIREAVTNGNCWLEYDELVAQANNLLIMDSLDSRELIERELTSLIDGQHLACVTHGGRFIIGLPEIHEKEQDLATILGKGAAANPHFSAINPKDIDPLITQQKKSLTKKQHEAVANALRYSISLVSGGAGSGKSYLLATIKDIYEQQPFIKVVLTAPTGKAAKRLEEVCQQEATTIHRLLGYDGKTFTHSWTDPIEADILLVDEFSMVDVFLAWHLFDAIDLNKTAVVLVGDHNQLPPVGPGNILRDLIHNKVVPTIILDKVIRQAGVLKENCTAVLQG